MPAPASISDMTKGTLLTPPPVVYRARLEVALTLDGTTPYGTPKVYELAPGGSVQALGTAFDLWGAAPTPGDLGATTFGVLIRRPDQFADEATETARSVESVQVTAYYNPPAGSLVMPERIASTQFNIIGKETVRGTAVNPSVRLKAATCIFQPANEEKQYDFQGDLLPGDFAIVAEASEGAIEGFVAYDEIGWWLASIAGKPVTTTVSAGYFRHQFNLNARAIADILTYTMEYGDRDNGAERVAHAIVSELGLRMNRKDIGLSGKALGRQIIDRTQITAGANSVQTLTMGTATSFRLRFNGAETAAINTAGLTASAIQTALQGLSTVGAGNMTVSGAGPFVITAAGTLAGVQLPLIEIAAFSGGTTPTVAYTTAGGYTEHPIVPVLPGQVSAYYANDLASLGAGKLTRVFNLDFNIANRFAPFWVFDDTTPSWAGTAETPTTVSAKVTVMADSVAQGMATDARNRTRKYFRIQAVGPDVTAGNPNRIQIDMAAKVRLIDNFREEQEIFAREFEVSATFDPAWGQAVQIVIHNGISAY